MKYKLVAVDIDGTVLNSKFKISPRTQAAMIKAIEKGALYVTATGRAMKGAEFINDIFDKDLPFIVYNGASVVMGKSKKVLFNKFLEESLAREVFDIGHQRDIPMVIWTDDGLWTSSLCQKTIDYNKYYNIEINIIDSLDDIAGSNVFKIFWVGTAEKNQLIQTEMRNHFAGRLNCATSQPEYLEFFSVEAGKEAALDAVGKLYGIKPSEMIAIGDGFNDIPMLEYAGLGVAMGNAPEAVKAASNHVAFSNNDDGVAAVIEEFVLV